MKILLTTSLILQSVTNRNRLKLEQAACAIDAVIREHLPSRPTPSNSGELKLFKRNKHESNRHFFAAYNSGKCLHHVYKSIPSVSDSLIQGESHERAIAKSITVTARKAIDESKIYRR